MLSKIKYAALCVLGMEVFYALCIGYGLLLSGKAMGEMSGMMGDMRQMMESGKMTPEEMEHMSKMMGDMSGMMKQMSERMGRGMKKTQ